MKSLPKGRWIGQSAVIFSITRCWRCPWLLPSPQRFRAAANRLELVRQGVLDGALLSGLELEEAEGVNRQELELLPLGELPLALGFCPEAPILVGAVPEVLVPDRGVAPGLRRGPDGRPATTGGLKVCAPCINPRLAAPSASGVLPHGFR